MSVTPSEKRSEQIQSRDRDPVGEGEVRCAACGTVIDKEDYPHDCGPTPEPEPADGAHYIGPSTTPYHGNDPHHI